MDSGPDQPAGTFEVLGWRDGHIVAIDQTVLPHEIRMLHLTTVDELVDAITRLAVRGAPVLGVAGALGVALAARLAEEQGWDEARLAACRKAAGLYHGELAEGEGYDWTEPYAETARRRALDAWTIIAEILQPTDPDQALSALETALADLRRAGLHGTTAAG